MRTLPALALVLAACGLACDNSDGRDQDTAHGASPSSPSRGPDAIALRVPRGGGTARAFVYARLDSVAWRSTEAVPSIDRVLAFDAEAGVLAFVSTKGLPARVDLRLGRVSTASKTKLTSLASADGSAIFGIGAGGVVVRLTPTGDWSFDPPSRPRVLLPQPDGSLIVVADRAGETLLWKLRPPESAIGDSAVLPRIERAARTPVGDRLYFTVDSGLIAVSGRQLDPLPFVKFSRPIRALAPTPSGDRLYIAEEERVTLSVVDRYSEKVASTLELPGRISDLRMDPLGRYLLVRPARGDSAWVVAIGTDRVIGSVRTAWLADLPAVAPDGAVALAQGADVVLVDGETLAPQRTIEGGTADFWYFFFWNGFRPRAAVLDVPVSFPSDEPVVDSIPPDSTVAAPFPSAPDTATPPRTPPAQRDTAPAAQTGFTVQFGALLSEDKARELAASIKVGGESPRVVATVRSGATIYRVIMGPFASKADAERVGRDSRHSFWIYEGAP